MYFAGFLKLWSVRAFFLQCSFGIHLVFKERMFLAGCW